MTVYINYELAFKWINKEADDRSTRFSAKLALITKLTFHTHDVRAFNLPWARKVASSTSFAGSRQVLEDFRQSLRDAERAIAMEQEKLQQCAGSELVDEEGRRLDRREFKETRTSLYWLHTCQMGWYRREGRYRTDLLDKILNNDFTRQGLPPDSGILVRVSQDGQSWYAWRMTISNWYFAIGAEGPPPDEWLYDGPEPPNGFPGKDSLRDDRLFYTGKSSNWT